jgi:hypothetical protein
MRVALEISADYLVVIADPGIVGHIVAIQAVRVDVESAEPWEPIDWVMVETVIEAEKAGIDHFW